MDRSLQRHIQAIDKKLYNRLKNATPQSFARVWVSHHDYAKHLKKRLRHHDIQDAADYLTKAKEAFLHPHLVYYAKNRGAKLLYLGEGWVDVVSSDGRLITSYHRYKPIEDILKKERMRDKKVLPIASKEIESLRKTYTKKG